MPMPAAISRLPPAEYQQVLDKWPQSPLAPHALYGLGWVKLSQNDPAAAEKLFDEWLEKYPDHKLIPRVRYARGMARHQLKDFAAAIDDIQASWRPIRRRPRSPTPDTCWACARPACRSTPMRRPLSKRF